MEVQAAQVIFNLLVARVGWYGCFEPGGETSDLFLAAGGTDHSGAELEGFGVWERFVFEAEEVVE